MPTNHTISVEEKIAQLFMLGYEGKTSSTFLDKFLDAGLGGIIFFRDNFQHFQKSQDVSTLLQGFQKKRLATSPELFLSLDQEGGQVERLPHTIFPSLITPLAIAMSKNPADLAKLTYTIMATHLAALGFNFNYSPTLDVNLEPKNPIIGVRAFGNEPKQVWQLGKIAKDCFWQAGIIPVGKHFPGHGNGTVDSHLNLPHLKFTETELSPFRQAIDDGIPVMLVSHGFYPDLQTAANEFEKPASASKTIIQSLLREKCRFRGLIISDDMCMGAITQGKAPVEAAIQSIEAGIDMLVYKQSTEAEWNVYQGLIQAVKDGRLSIKRIDEAYNNITQLKATRLTPAHSLPEVENWTSDYLNQQSISIAEKAITALEPTKWTVSDNSQWLLLHPDRSTITNYRFDQPTSKELPDLLAGAGLNNITDIAYSVEIPGHHAQPVPIPQIPTNLELTGIVFVTFNPLIQPVQQALYKLLKTTYPNAPIMLVSAGTPYDKQILTDTQGHVALCSYRPPTMAALANFLSQQLVAPGKSSSLSHSA